MNRCVDSMIVPEVLDQLEIIIVNDGSTDGTLAIANKYKEEYPQSVVVIDKPNGHYGSCVNASLKVATGKYFRIVDADDWVDSEALAEFVKRLGDIDVDCVCTNYTVQNLKDNVVTERYVDISPNVVLDLESNSLPEESLHMHNLTYSLNLLKRINYTQTEGICYTDVEYVYLPLSCSKDLVYFDISLYQYFIGRDDQSMNWQVVQKNFPHLIKVNQRLMDEHKNGLSYNANESFIWSVLIERVLSYIMPAYLLGGEFKKSIDALLRSSLRELNQCNHSLPLSIFKNRFHGIRYVSLWYHTPLLFRLVSLLFIQPFLKRLE